jgi:hypothetical protein
MRTHVRIAVKRRRLEGGRPLDELDVGPATAAAPDMSSVIPSVMAFISSSFPE